MINYDEYYLDLCKIVLKASACLFCQCAAIIVDKDNEIISTGYSHPMDESLHCKNNGICSYYRETGAYPHVGKQDEYVSLHAEIYAILSADRERLKDATMYIAGYDMIKKQYKTIIPDAVVLRIIQAAGIKRVCSLQGEEYQVLEEILNEKRSKKRKKRAPDLLLD